MPGSTCVRWVEVPLNLRAQVNIQGCEGAIELHVLPRYAPEYKQELQNEPMPESTSGLRDMIGSLLDRMAGMRAPIRGYFQQAEIDMVSS